MTEQQKREIVAMVLEEIIEAVSASELKHNSAVRRSPEPSTLSYDVFERQLRNRVKTLREG